jgi:hypothetical protein
MTPRLKMQRARCTRCKQLRDKSTLDGDGLCYTCRKVLADAEATKPVRLEHIQRTDCNGDCGGTCSVCCLFICKVCGLFEGCLTSDCPGEASYKEHSDAVYAGKEDFRDGKWVEACSPHSPEYYRRKTDAT